MEFALCNSNDVQDDDDNAHPSLPLDSRFAVSQHTSISFLSLFRVAARYSYHNYVFMIFPSELYADPIVRSLIQVP
jgi:hypothetical protein